MEILHPVAEKHRRQILYKCTWWASGMCSTRQKINSFFYHSWLSSIISLSHLKPYSPVYFTNADVPPSLRGWASLLDLQRIYVFVVESGRWWTEVWIKMDRILSVLFLRQSDQCLWFAAGVHTFEEEKKKNTARFDIGCVNHCVRTGIPTNENISAGSYHPRSFLSSSCNLSLLCLHLYKGKCSLIESRY